MGQGGQSFICSKKGLIASLINQLCFPDSSVGKESACNAGTPVGILGQGRSPAERIGYPLQFLGFPCGSAGKESACNVGNLGLVPGLGRFLGEGKGYPLQYSSLENSTDYIIRAVAKSRTWLNNFHFTLGRDCFWANWLPSTEVLSERVITSRGLPEAFIPSM